MTEPSLGQLAQLYLDINNLHFNNLADILDKILAQQHNNLYTYHPLGYVWYYFDRLVRGEISRDQFLALGDVEGLVDDQINPHVYREEHPVYLDTLTPELVTSWTDQDLVLVDQTLWTRYTTHYPDAPSLATLLVL